MPASPQAAFDRLQAQARARAIDTEHLIYRYIAEAYLARLSASEHVGSCVLKGGFLFTLWEGDLLRSTRDVDLHMGLRDRDAAPEILLDVAVQKTPQYDGVDFHVNTAHFRTLVGGGVPGLRLSMDASLGHAICRFCVDIGFDHPIHPGAERRYYPRLFPELASFPLWAYPRETVVAEKLAVAVEFGRCNTRLRDHYDLWYLSLHYHFLGHTLLDSTESTFSKREAGSFLCGDPNYWHGAFSERFATPASNKSWQHWIAQHSPVEAPPRLQDVVDRVAMFSLPILMALREGRPLKKHWHPGPGWLPDGSASKRTSMHSVQLAALSPGNEDTPVDAPLNILPGSRQFTVK